MGVCVAVVGASDYVGGLWEGEHALKKGGGKTENGSEDMEVDVVGCVEDDVGVDIVEGGLGSSSWRWTVVSHSSVMGVVSKWHLEPLWL